MEKICAWCKKDMGHVNSEIYSDAVITHGICFDCANNYFSDMGTELSDFLDEINAPIAVIDSDGIVKTCNTRARILLGKSTDEIDGYRGGEVFECVYSRLPEGCGRTIHCSGCTIRWSVMDTFESGDSKLEVPAYLNQGHFDDYERVSFVISTEKISDIVLLRIDKINNKQVA